MGGKQERKRKLDGEVILKPAGDGVPVPSYLRRVKSPEEMGTQAMEGLSQVIGKKILHLDELNEAGIATLDRVIEARFMEAVDAGRGSEAASFMEAYYVRGDKLTDGARAWKQKQEERTSK